MKQYQLQTIQTMRQQGCSAADIAKALNMSSNTVKSYLRRHPTMGDVHLCPQCNLPVKPSTKHRKKKFCSDKCRMAYWNSHPELIDKKAYYRLTCQHCGKEFESYGNKERKYCGRECYTQVRRRSS